VKTYLVEGRLKHPSCYHTGYDFTVHARTKAEAIRWARVRAADQGHTRHDGPLVFKATEQEY
jgi:hypothetical protein